MIELTKRQYQSFNRIRKTGGTVMCHHGNGRLVYYQLANGRSVSQPVFHRLVEIGALIPNQDGLFADAPQTYRCADHVSATHEQ